MLCENCGQREATIHEVLIDASNTKREKHLCEVCAAGGGPPEKPQESVPAPVSELIGKFMVGGPTAPGKGAPGTPSCASCGTTYAKFKQTGLLGCPDCYSAFEERLGPLIERAHEGGSHHVGKIPKRALEDSRGGGRLETILGDPAERTRRLAELHKALHSAVQGEKYERAAEIKQEIEQLRTLLSEGDA
ncbi:MAG: UvrB/UvrC motif-containing protein [Phycisphaerales bacterium JB040]